MSPLPPSRRDNAGPGRNVTDLSALVRHDRSYLRSLDPGFLDGRFATPQPVPGGLASDLVGDDDTGGGGDDAEEILFENGDQITITETSSSYIFRLTYAPIEGSLHIHWNGIDQPAAEWTVEDNVVTIPDPTGLVRGGDLFSAAYAYYPTESAADEIEDSGLILVPFESDGWRFLQVASVDSADYSDPAFDDSAWAVASAPFGETTPAHTVAATFNVLGVDWPEYVTAWDQGTKLWARRVIADADAGVPVSVSFRWNRDVAMWWNGAYTGETTGAAGESTRVVPGELVLASNVLVIKIKDDGFSGFHTGCYFDAKVVQ